MEDVTWTPDVCYNEIGALNPGLDACDIDAVVATFEERAYELWENVVVPFLDQAPSGLLSRMQRLSQFMDFLNDSSYGLDKLQVQLRIDALKLRMAEAHREAQSRINSSASSANVCASLPHANA